MQGTPDLILGSMIGLLGTALYGLSVVVYRSQADEIHPIAVSSIKMWVALPFMVLMALFWPGVDTNYLPMIAVVLLSASVILGAVLGDTIYLWSQQRIGVSYAFPIATSFPIITFFMTVGFLGEALVLSRLIGAVIAVVGVVLISNEQNRTQKNLEVPLRPDFLGILAAVLTAVLYAAGTTVLQVGIEGVDPIVGNLIRVIVGSIAFVPVVIAARFGGMALPTRRATALVMVAAFFGMAVGSLFYVMAVAMVGAAIMSVIASSAPLFAIPVSVLILKERISTMVGIGVIATIFGVVLVVLGA
ncbi:MAG: DMT family transporter [Promethearchaeota archaeon]